VLRSSEAVIAVRRLRPGWYYLSFPRTAVYGRCARRSGGDQPRRLGRGGGAVVATEALPMPFDQGVGVQDGRKAAETGRQLWGGNRTLAARVAGQQAVATAQHLVVDRYRRGVIDNRRLTVATSGDRHRIPVGCTVCATP